MTITYRSTPDDAIQRDGYGRPVVGGVAHTRVSTVAKTLEDGGGLIKWSGKAVLLGVANRPELGRMAYSHRDEPAKLAEIQELAMQASGLASGAMIGTSLHALTEQFDRAVEAAGDRDKIAADFIAAVPDPLDRADLQAYADETWGLQTLGAEVFVVDRHRVTAGTADRLVRFGGRSFLADLKTGKSATKYILGATAIQLRAYAVATPYEDPRAWPADFDPDVGLLVHLPQGSGKCRVEWLDLAYANEGLDLALAVREWRSGHARRVRVDEPAERIVEVVA